MSTKSVAAGIGGLVLLGALTGCDPDVEPEPVVVTETVTAEPEPTTEEPEPGPNVEREEPSSEPEPEPEPTEDAAPISDEEIGRMALDLTWSGMPASDRSDICEAWGWGPAMQEMLLDEFFKGSGDQFVSRSYAQQFFDKECN